MIPHLRFISINDPLIESLQSERFEQEHSARIGAHADLIYEVSAQMMSFIQEKPRPAPWIGYLAVNEATQTVVGTCAFKGAPDEAGEVEIAYFTFPEFENQGYATMMANQLCDMAFASSALAILAHTLPQPNASTRVLGKCGFTFVEEIHDDPDDGHVWRWRRER